MRRAKQKKQAQRKKNEQLKKTGRTPAQIKRINQRNKKQ